MDAISTLLGITGKKIQKLIWISSAKQLNFHTTRSFSNLLIFTIRTYKIHRFVGYTYNSILTHPTAIWNIIFCIIIIYIILNSYNYLLVDI